MDPFFSSIPVAPPPAPSIPPPATTAVGGPPPSFDHPALKDANGSSKMARSEAPIPDSTLPNPPHASTGLKRTRGRPPKTKPAIPAAAAASAEPVAQPQPPQQPDVVLDVTKRSPGRPRKNGPVAQLGVRKGRGRPPKTGLKKSPGRPKKPKTVRSVVGANATKRGRGRPPKALNQLLQQLIQGEPVAVPYADTAAADAITTTITTTAIAASPRPRGRPKGTTVAAAAGVVVREKRRGRPPKISGAAKPITPRKSTGNPVGRPKKTSGGAASYADLKRKLEFLQSKVKQAVEVLKSQFSGESNISTIDAILELEGLAAMDISKPFKEDAQPPLPPEPTQPPPVLQNEGQVY
ncbi:hypothetical protein V6N13_099263 [Hibiscus sabdariffa]|uniref:Uncharacterized protein n=1 Tax=Hibiscus sabdariffa TaxID=183260 RepID=A0ABR2PZC2_9ROSI